jgi:hypothetical protein
MKFLEQAKSSIYSPSFYDEVITTRSFRSSIWYFYSLTLILSFITTVLLAINLVPAVNRFLNDTTASLLEHYPNELVLTFKGGHASSNVGDKEPYVIPLPEGFKSTLSASDGDVQSMLVIDTTHPLDLTKFREEKTFALLTADELVMLDRGGSVKIQSLDQVPDQVIDKKKVSAFVDGIHPLFKFAGPLLVVIIFLGLLVGSSLYLVYLFFLALIVLVIAKAKKRPLGYKKSYQVGIHAMTISLILTTIKLNFFGSLDTSFVFLLVFGIMVWINLSPMGGETPEAIKIVPDPQV